MKKRLGQWGEQLAEKYLREKGYTILVRNYRTRQGEIDLICVWRGILVFVEVKTRKSTAFGYPEEAVTYQKRQHLKAAAMSFLQEKEHPGYQSVRFDVIAILIDKVAVEPKINHIKNAF